MNWSVFYGILIPFLGTSFGAACVFYEKGDGRPTTAYADGICRRCDGGGVDLESFDSGDGAGWRYGKAGVCAGSRRVLAWDPVSSSARPYYPASAP